MSRIEVQDADHESILRWRDLYRHEMNCQIVHDSLHARPGWTTTHRLLIDGVMVGYGLVVIGGPWKGKPTICEFYLLPQARTRAFELFEALLRSTVPHAIEVQSNDMLVTAMLHAFATDVKSDSILFHDGWTTQWQPPGAIFRQADFAESNPDEGDWVVEFEGRIAARGGLLFHYNRPYGDVFMSVAEPCRRRGLGSYLVQEIKRIAYETGNIPSARCNPRNLASRHTLQKAGFVPCAHMLHGVVTQP